MEPKTTPLLRDHVLIISKIAKGEVGILLDTAPITVGLDSGGTEIIFLNKSLEECVRAFPKKEARIKVFGIEGRVRFAMPEWVEIMTDDGELHEIDSNEWLENFEYVEEKPAPPFEVGDWVYVERPTDRRVGRVSGVNTYNQVKEPTFTITFGESNSIHLYATNLKKCDKPKFLCDETVIVDGKDVCTITDVTYNHDTFFYDIMYANGHREFEIVASRIQPDEGLRLGDCVFVNIYGNPDYRQVGRIVSIGMNVDKSMRTQYGVNFNMTKEVEYPSFYSKKDLLKCPEPEFTVGDEVLYCDKYMMKVVKVRRVIGGFKYTVHGNGNKKAEAWQPEIVKYTPPYNEGDYVYVTDTGDLLFGRIGRVIENMCDTYKVNFGLSPLTVFDYPPSSLSKCSPPEYAIGSRVLHKTYGIMTVEAAHRDDVYTLTTGKGWSRLPAMADDIIGVVK